MFRNVDEQGGKGRLWMKLEQKTSIYNVGKWAGGTAVEIRNLDNGERQHRYLPLEKRPNIFAMKIGQVIAL